MNEEIQQLMDLCVASTRQSERRAAVEQLVELLTKPRPEPECTCTEKEKPWCICYSGR